MENGNWSLFNSSSNNNNSTTCGSSRGQNSNCNNNLAWDTWELGTSLFGWGSSSRTTPNNNNNINNINNNNPFYQTATNTTTATSPKPLMLNSLYGGGAGESHIHPDPHLMCLKLGKRQYFEDVMASPLGDCHVGGLSVKKKGRGVARPPPSTAAVVVAKCRVEGCEVGLGKAKEYHRRHKVCEIHSKAEKAVVHGVDQRFCQQCSRFHEVSEFDDSKRSCRRRLVGHNLRRRKRSLHSIATNPFQEKKMMGERFPYVSSLTGHALSLLSTKRNSWLSASDFSSQCSAALHELIAENRTAMNGTQPASSSLDPHQMFTEPHGRSWWTLDA